MSTKVTQIKSGSHVKRESYFIRFRKRWKRRGVIEIDESHNKHPFTLYVRQGLQDSIAATKEFKGQGTDKQYSQEIHRKLVSSHDKTEFEFVTYAPEVFESLREQVDMFPDTYYDRICPDDNEIKYLEFVSNSKSGQNFFLSNNKQLMIKTHTRNEKNFFLKILPSYINHLKRYPHSLIVRYLGLYKITISKHDPVYFIVMQSILYPDERINQRFDLKGCQAGRFTKEQNNDQNEIITVLKDMNFEETKIFLGSQSSWFDLQIQHDTEFLRSLRVIDYSLLIGVQSLHQEEIKENRELASIIVRTKKSTSRQHSVLRHWAQSPTRMMKQISEESEVSQSSSPDENINLPGTVQEENESDTVKSNSTKSTSSIVSPKKSTADSRDSVNESESIMQNRRLLPQCRNELHIIDGSNQERYFIGIIDFFTPFGLKKRCEGIFKAMKYKKSGYSYSTVNPDAYADRFQEFLKKHVV
ncbi:phosphatidylinositol 4-phosphate 5-kinase-like protein 1 [Styela clava]